MTVKLLSKLDHGEKGTIVKIRGAVTTHRYLFERGLFVGRSISIEKANVVPSQTPIEVRVNSSVLYLEKELAANIQVALDKV